MNFLRLWGWKCAFFVLVLSWAVLSVPTSICAQTSVVLFGSPGYVEAHRALARTAPDAAVSGQPTEVPFSTVELMQPTSGYQGPRLHGGIRLIPSALPPGGSIRWQGQQRIAKGQTLGTWGPFDALQVQVLPSAVAGRYEGSWSAAFVVPVEGGAVLSRLRILAQGAQGGRGGRQVLGVLVQDAASGRWLVSQREKTTTSVEAFDVAVASEPWRFWDPVTLEGGEPAPPPGALAHAGVWISGSFSYDSPGTGSPTLSAWTIGQISYVAEGGETSYAFGNDSALPMPFREPLLKK